MDNTIKAPAERVLDLLKSQGITVTFAESCTGGLAAAKLVSLPSASAVFAESFVTYANEAKIRRLGVSPESISRFGVVSEEVAGQMASGAAKTAKNRPITGLRCSRAPVGNTMK